MVDRLRLTDYSMMLDLSSRIAEATTEAVVVRRIMDLFTELCAAESLAYLCYVDGRPGELHVNQGVPEERGDVRERLELFDEDWALAETGSGFLLRISRDGETLGVIEVEDIMLRAHVQHYLNLALSNVGVFALAVANARNYERLEGARASLEIERDVTRAYLDLSQELNDINTHIGSTLVGEEILSRAIEDGRTALGAELGCHLTLGDRGWELSGGCGKGISVEWIQAVAPVLDKALRYRDATAVSGHDAGISVMAVPLQADDDEMLVFSSTNDDHFTEPRVEFARRLATSVSLALQNARLFKIERDIADSLQQALLVMPDEVPGIEFSHKYRSAKLSGASVGGDFYDLFELGNGRLGLVVGDVSGKGLEAAKLTSLIKDTVRAYAWIDRSPAGVIDKTNSIVFGATNAHTFATVFFGVLDPATGRLTYCSAGHLPALIDDGISTRTLDAMSPLLGAFDGLTFSEDTAHLRPGERLLLYTDGVTEARCPDGLYGEERLTDTLLSCRADDLSDVPSRILSSVEDDCGGMFTDDVAILCLTLAEGGNEGGSARFRDAIHSLDVPTALRARTGSDTRARLEPGSRWYTLWSPRRSEGWQSLVYCGGLENR